MISSKTLSHNSHDQTDYLVRTLEEWKKYNDEFSKREFDTEQVKVKTLLEKHQKVRDFAIDIGCGGGWMAVRCRLQWLICCKRGQRYCCQLVCQSHRLRLKGLGVRKLR